MYVSQHVLNGRALLSIYDPQVEAERLKYDFAEYKILDPELKLQVMSPLRKTSVRPLKAVMPLLL